DHGQFSVLSFQFSVGGFQLRAENLKLKTENWSAFEKHPRQLHAVLLEPLGEARADARRLELPDDLALLVHAAPLEEENLLHRDDVALHARDLGDGGDAARAVGEARDLYDEVDGRGDLRAHGLFGQA